MITLERVAHDSSFGTLGKLTIKGEVFWTIEQDWENNLPFKSCIPNGEYYLFKYNSPKYGKCYIMENESLNVAKYKKEGVKRFACLVHPANKASQLQGCIAPGLKIGMLGDELAVLNSRKALERIHGLLETEKHSTIPHTINIISKFPAFIEE